MRTNIVINDELMRRAMELSGLKTKREVVEQGLKRLILMEQKKELLQMEGRVTFSDDYDPKSLRRSGWKTDTDSG
jgi:Arc/MetJ family transcription regulator